MHTHSQTMLPHPAKPGREQIIQGVMARRWVAVGPQSWTCDLCWQVVEQSELVQMELEYLLLAQTSSPEQRARYQNPAGWCVWCSFLPWGHDLVVQRNQHQQVSKVRVS